MSACNSSVYSPGLLNAQLKCVCASAGKSMWSSALMPFALLKYVSTLPKVPVKYAKSAPGPFTFVAVKRILSERFMLYALGFITVARPSFVAVEGAFDCKDWPDFSSWLACCEFVFVLLRLFSEANSPSAAEGDSSARFCVFALVAPCALCASSLGCAAMRSVASPSQIVSKDTSSIIGIISAACLTLSSASCTFGTPFRKLASKAVITPCSSSIM